MEIKTLKGISAQEILNAFNESFSDYFIPFHLSQAQLESKMEADKVAPNLSVGVFENGQLIAFILHGFDIINNEKIIYNGGTGVIPNKRGIGLTKQMYQYILPSLKEKGIDKLILEVISENTQAIRSYQKSGYEVDRELICYKGEITLPLTSTDVEIKELPSYNWDILQTFWDTTPTWQNSINVVNELKASNTSLGAYYQNQLVGYLIYNPTSNRLQQIAIKKTFRQKKVATALIQQLCEKHGNTLSIINVDKASKPLNLFLEKVGLKSFIEQLEMKLHPKRLSTQDGLNT